MKALLVVACGGALGASARYLVFIASSHFLGHSFPFATVIVNALGSFALGLLAEGMALAWTLPASLRLFLVVGVLGSFTTFSTFSLDVALLYERGQLAKAAIYVASSLILSVGGLFAGMAVMRQVLGPAA